MSSEVPKGLGRRWSLHLGDGRMRGLFVRSAVLGSAAVVALGTAAVGSAATHHPKKPHLRFGTAVKGSLPAVGRPVSGGTVSLAQLTTGSTPTYILPLASAATASTGTFALYSQLWVPLYDGPLGARPQVNYRLSAASGPPKPSDHDKTYTIHLKRGLRWSNGQPVVAEDVAFDIALLKAAVKLSPANWAQFTPGQFPQSVTKVQTPNATTVVIHLNRAYNPGYFLNNQLQDTNGGVFPLPANSWDTSTGSNHLTDWATNTADAEAIYKYLDSQSKSLGTWATNPLWKVVDGPYKLTAFSTTDSAYTLAPNPKYSLSPKARATFQVQSFTSETAEMNALLTGAVDIGPIDPATQLRELPALRAKGYSVFGAPSWGWFGGIINFKDKTANFDKVIAQPYMRAALAELIDQPAIIKGVYHGWAVPGYGPVPTAPFSPYAPKNASVAPFPYSPKQAVATLRAHGWKVVPGGTTRCVKPGAGKGHCGAGIPKGNPISMVWANLPESTNATGLLESEAFQGTAKKYAGVKITLQSKPFNFLTESYNLAATKKFINAWGVNNFGGINIDYYPTQDGIENPGAGFNMGDFNDPKANRLMNASVFSANLKAIDNEVSYLRKHYPVFYFPVADQIWAVSNKVGGSANAFLELTQQQWSSNLFYTVK